jgi:hypothetical protein
LLQDLPARMTAVEGRLTVVEAQIVQLRADMNNGFAALSYAINRMHSEMISRSNQSIGSSRRWTHASNESTPGLTRWIKGST